MKKDKRTKMYRFLANEEESKLIEMRYIQSSCSSISEFFRQAIVNDMLIQNSDEELKNINLLLSDISHKLSVLSAGISLNKETFQEIEREVNMVWQQLLSIQSTLRKQQL